MKLGVSVKLGYGVTLGNGVKLGDGVELGNGVKLGATPLAVQGTSHLAVNVGPGVIQIGCFTLTFDQWVTDYEQMGLDHAYSAEQIVEYKRIIDFIVANGVPPEKE